MRRRLLIYVMLLGLIAPSVMSAEDLRYRVVPVKFSNWVNPDNVDDVRKEIDRIAADGYNMISVGSFSFMPVYLLDYSDSPYPEAAHFSPEKIAKQVSAFRSHITYAKERGIRWVVTCSNSHYVPWNYYKAHLDELNPGGLYDDLLMKSHQNEMYQKAVKGKGMFVQCQQWTNPCYHDFFVWSTREVLREIPELDGFLNAYAESAWSYSEDALRKGEWKSWKDCVDYDLTNKCYIDYVKTLHTMLKEERGEDFFLGMRDWYLTPQVLAAMDIPKQDIVISVKYAGYDQPLVNFPPWAKDLKDAGFGVILDIHIYDAEWPSPVYWYDNDVISKIFSNIRNEGFSGIVNQDYVLRGSDKVDNPIRRLTQRTASSAMNGRSFSDQDALKVLSRAYGIASADILASLKCVAEAHEQTVKLYPAWFWRGDGMSVGGVQPLQLWQLFDNPEAPSGMAFVRQDVVGVPEYVEWFLANGKDDDKAQEHFHALGRKTPLDVVTTLESKSDEAISLMQSAKAKIGKGYYLKDLVASSYLNRAVCLRNADQIKAALCLYKSGWCWNGKYETSKEKKIDTGLDLREPCKAAVNDFIQQDLLMRRIMKEYSPRRRTLRHENTYKNEKNIGKMMQFKVTTEDQTENEFNEIKYNI